MSSKNTAESQNLKVWRNSVTSKIVVYNVNRDMMYELKCNSLFPDYDQIRMIIRICEKLGVEEIHTYLD